LSEPKQNGDLINLILLTVNRELILDPNLVLIAVFYYFNVKGEHLKICGSNFFASSQKKVLTTSVFTQPQENHLMQQVSIPYPILSAYR